MVSHDGLIPLGWGEFYEKQVTPPESQSLLAARVAAVYKYSYSLVDASGPLQGVVSGRLLREDAAHPDLPVAGDWVLAKPPVGGNALIIRCLSRRSELSRRRPLDRNSNKTSHERQVLAANIDFVFIVMSLNHDLNLQRLERALTMVWNSGATPVVLLSKADLCPDPEARAGEVAAVAAGVKVHVFSGLKATGLEAILNYLKTGVTGCLIGSSGVGKTTLINALCKTHYKTLSIREDDDRGRHATTTRSLFNLPKAGMLIDTPGLREIGLMDEAGIAVAFADIIELGKQCKFADCTHQVEPGCAVLAAVQEKKIAQEYYDNYLKLRREMEYQDGKHSPAKQQELKKKQKQLSRRIKDYFKSNPS